MCFIHYIFLVELIVKLINEKGIFYRDIYSDLHNAHSVNQSSV